MGLAKYKQKRSFDHTPEPEGGEAKGESLLFVIQKHEASHLHYDFRLELGGVLKSWAVPKGPSTDPSVKRLAMMVEDHPYDYKDFEGIIPEGNYGAGTVMIWDQGTYEPLELAGTKKNMEKALLKELRNGSLKIRLKGKRLKGEFALVKTKGMGQNSWLLLKHKDKYASKADITKKDRSVVSRRAMATIAKDKDNIYNVKKKKRAGSTARVASPAKKISSKKVKQELEAQVDKKKVTKPAAKTDVAALLAKAPKKRFPAFFKPMLATLVNKPFDEEGWEYEVKWDGYRALAFLNKTKIELWSRNNKSFNDKFYPVFDAIKNWGIHAVVDGEIVVVNRQGISDFNALQNWRSEADGQLLYYVFDILWLNGKDLTGMPLTERKEILATLIPDDDSIIRNGFSIEAKGTRFFEVAGKMGLEGIIAKRSESKYIPGDRSKDWLKIKAHKRQEVVIGGYTHNEGSPKLFSALLLGVYKGSRLHYAGKVGTGFTEKMQKEMIGMFKQLKAKKNPFSVLPDYNKPSRFRPDPPAAAVTWLRPQLVCEINYTEITEDGVFRHPSFAGMRIDKAAKEVTAEKEQPVEKVVAAAEAEDNLTEGEIIKAPAKNSRKTLLNPKEKAQVKKVGGHTLKFTNLDKLFWPDEKITKRDLLNYYYQVAPFILPYLKNRPQSLNRFPNGIKGKSFYQKDVTGKAPGWADTYLYHSEGDKTDKHFLLGNNEATLLFMANSGAIEMNPWSSTVKHPDHPDFCIIDLDPDKNSFEQVIEAAQVTKEVLDSIGVPSYCKTSGSTGLHVYIPLGAKYTYDQSKEFARLVVTLVQQKIPRFTTLERKVADRKGKMYLDFLQNRAQATIAAAYSARPKPGATVSAPLLWEEVRPGLKMKDFTIFNMPGRLKDMGDLFKPVLGKGIDLDKVIRRYGNTFMGE